MTSTLWPQDRPPLLAPSETVLTRSSAVSSALSPFQNQIDGLVSSFVEQASDWKTLSAITAGGLAYRYGKIAVMNLGVGAIGRSPLRVASIAFGLGSEVTAFEFTNRFLHTIRATGQSPLQNQSPNNWSWSGPGGWKEGWLNSFVAFGTLKGFGKLAQGQNLVLRHGFQDAGMVLGHQLVYRAGIGAKPEGSLAEQFVHAEAVNLQLEAGMGLSHALTGGRILALERGLDLSLASNISPPSLWQNTTPHLAMAGAGGAGKGSLPIDPIKVNRSLMMEGGDKSESGNGESGKWKEVILSHLQADTLPALDSLLSLRQRFVDLMRRAEVPKEIKSKVIKELVAVHRLLQQGQGEEGKFKEAWEKLQELGSELGLEFEEWLNSENVITTLSIEQPTQKLSSPKPSVPEKIQNPSPAVEPQEVIRQRQTGIDQALQDLTQTIHGLKKILPPEDRDAYREELKRLDRVCQFIEGQWQGFRATGEVRGGWSREAIERVQLDLLGRIKSLKEGLKFTETSNAPTALRPWLLRDYQQEMILGLDRDLTNKDLPWLGLASPMQTGKSYLIGPLIEVLRRHYGTGARIIILTSAEIITDQVMGDLLQGLQAHQVGRYDGDTKDIRDVTVASYRALAYGNNLNRHFSPDGRPVLLINDEAYSTQSQSFQKIYTHFGLAETVGKGRNTVLKPKQGNGRVIGLSGTGAGLEGYNISGQFDLFSALQTGRIRHMELDQVLLKLSSEQREMAGEKMIWWEATLENARALVEIYDQRMHRKVERTLTYVPTIRHAQLFEQAMAERYGEEYNRAYHSKMNDGALKEALSHHETKGGNLTSVGMLNRGYRGTGVGAVFHTYRSDSSELVLQRTGRAWGVPEGEALPDLYVLEAAWSERDSFATVARLLGLVDAPRMRFSTRDLEKSVTAIRRRRQWETERDQKIVIGEVTPLFKHVPLVEEWRTRFGEIVKTAGGVAAVAKQTDLPPEVIAGFALGSLPTELADMIRMKDYFGGEEKATDLWVRSWQQVVDDVLGGRGRVDGSLEKKLIAWRDQVGEAGERARSLDEILAPYFQRKSSFKQAKTEWVSPLFPEFKKAMKGTREEEMSDAELADAFQRELEAFHQYLSETNTRDVQVFYGRFMANPPQTLKVIGESLQLSRERTRTLEIELRGLFFSGVRGRHPPNWLPISELGLSSEIYDVLSGAGIHTFGDIPPTASELSKRAPLSLMAFWEINGVRVRFGLEEIFFDEQIPPEILESSVEELELSVRSANALQNAGIKTIGELLAKNDYELLKIKNFGRKSLKEVKELLAKYGLQLGRKKEEAQALPDQMLFPPNSLGQDLFPDNPPPPELLNMSVDELELSVRSTNSLQNANIKYVGQLLARSEDELLKIKNSGRKSLKEIKEILQELAKEGMELPVSGTNSSLPESSPSEPSSPQEVSSPGPSPLENHPQETNVALHPFVILTPISELSLGFKIEVDLEGAGVFNLGDLLNVRHIKGWHYQHLKDVKEWATENLVTTNLLKRLRENMGTTLYFAGSSPNLRQLRGLIYQELNEPEASKEPWRLFYTAVALRALGDSEEAHVVYDALRAMAIAKWNKIPGLTLKIIDGAEKEALAEKWWLKKPITDVALLFAIEKGDWTHAFKILKAQKDSKERLPNLVRVAMIFARGSLK